MLPEPEKDIAPARNLSSLFDYGVSKVSSLAEKVLPVSPQQNNSEKEINRVIIRQFTERPDIQKFLKEASSYFYAPLWVLMAIAISTGLITMLAAKSVVLGVVGLVFGTFIAVIVNAVRLSSHPERFYEKVKEISGGEDHLRVLEGMLKNTGFALKKSDSNTGPQWFLEELKNFIKKDKETQTKEVIKANNASLKTEVLRNIHTKE